MPMVTQLRGPDTLPIATRDSATGTSPDFGDSVIDATTGAEMGAATAGKVVGETGGGKHLRFEESGPRVSRGLFFFCLTVEETFSVAKPGLSQAEARDQARGRGPLVKPRAGALAG